MSRSQTETDSVSLWTHIGSDDRTHLGCKQKPRHAHRPTSRNSSATVMAAINEREARLREITNQVIEPGPESLQEKLEELRTFAVLRLTHLLELLTNPAAIHEARALLADQIGKFKLELVNENGRISFKANGNIDFFGEEVLTRLGGAGGQNRTGYARLFRAALYQ